MPAIAGQFYPEGKKELEKTINGLLTKADVPKINGEIFGLILPHAGYAYSGPVAACGYKAISGKEFDTVIIMGDSHYERFDGVAVWPEGFWETPLGRVEVDNKMAERIMAGSERFFRKDSAHLFEHSIEAQLPFLQKTLKDFKILPIVFGSEDEDWQLLAETILKNIGKNALIIASADLSHYLPYKKAKETDEKTLNNILSFRSQQIAVCAADSVKTLIDISKKLGGKAELLKYANSGDTFGDKSQVVGYGAVAFYKN